MLLISLLRLDNFDWFIFNFTQSYFSHPNPATESLQQALFGL